MDEIPTEIELFKQFELLKKLEKINKLKTLYKERRTLPQGCGAKDDCAIVLYEIGRDGIQYSTGDRGIRSAGKGNARFKFGQHHSQCTDCKKRNQNEAAIRTLEYDLGLKF